MSADPLPSPGQTLDERCARCGYSLEGLRPSDGGRCPECGAEAERMPPNMLFVCEPRGGLLRPGVRRVAIFFIACGLLALVAAVWGAMSLGGSIQRRLPIIIGPAVAGAVLPLVGLLVWRAHGTGRRIVVDLGQRRFRFERFVLVRPWRIGNSTGEGLEVGFDEVLGVESAVRGDLVVLRILLPRGTIEVESGFSNYRALLEVAQRVAPAAVTSRGGQRLDLILSLGALGLTLCIIAIGAQLGWW